MGTHRHATKCAGVPKYISYIGLRRGGLQSVIASENGLARLIRVIVYIGGGFKSLSTALT